ncbi:MAG: hypothetical protein HYV61_00625 [Candidatus Rokubacteria bacterium]|nr:hypothetical protein [Candidatus Rokubacteria bacterium]
MFPRVRRYADVALGLAVVALLVLLVVAGLGRRLDGVFRPSPPRVLLPAPAEVAVPPQAPTPATGPATDRPAAPGGPPAEGDASAARYALEAGPFLAAEAADRMEELLNRLGYATIRFRKQEVTRHYRVTVEGLDSLDGAKRVVAALGRGTIVEAPGGGGHVEVTKAASLREAVVAGRALKERGYEIRIVSTESPTTIYHVRYGQFLSEDEARGRGRELEHLGVESRVVRGK